MVEIIKDEWSDKLKEYFSFENTFDSSELDVNDLKNKPFPKNFLDKVHIKVNGEDLFIRNSKDSYLELQISSWKGISPGAQHYYGKLTIYDLDITHEYDSNSSCCGYLGKEKELPLSIKVGENFKLIVKRPITAKDIRFDKDRYYSYKKGELIKDFWTIESLKKEAQRIHQEFFPDYELKIEYD